MPFYSIGEVLRMDEGPTSTDPKTVDAEDEFAEALEEMVEEDFSQVPVEQNGEVSGVITHRSVYRALHILDGDELEEVTAGTVAEEASDFVDPDEDIYELFEEFATASYVLVGTPENVEGIVTYYDIFHFLKDHIRPFLLVGDIEQSLRENFREVYGDDLEDKIRETFEESASGIDTKRAPDTVDKFGFREYRIFISVNWKDGISEAFTEEKDFIDRRLEEVQEMRNALFHFREDGYAIDTSRLELAHDCLTDNYW